MRNTHSPIWSALNNSYLPIIIIYYIKVQLIVALSHLLIFIIERTVPAVK